MQSEVNESKSREWSPWGISAVTHCVVIGSLVFLPGNQTAATRSRPVIVTPLVYEPIVKVPPLRVTRPLVAPPVRIARLNMPVPETIPKPAVKQFQAFLREQPKAVAIQAPEQAKPVRSFAYSCKTRNARPASQASPRNARQNQCLRQ